MKTQTVYRTSDIPDNFTVHNQGTGKGVNAEFQAQGVIKGAGIIEEPDQFAIGNYNALADWNFNSNVGSVGDSGYSLKWNPRTTESGGSFSANTFYG
ncbi:hypothetical protein WMZ97_18445 [Lentibacillus sp. N15]|uniref:hypothetical protein n=1 Tax=Lentibacillus songyuanensis TaxID=3136161 RepID=UPI0031B9FCEA